MIVWSGFGFVVAVVGGGCLLLTQLGLAAAMKDHQYFEKNGWPKLLAFLVAAVIVWPLGRMLNHGRPDRELVDAETGERVTLRRGGHTFFFIPVEYWAPIFVLLGIVFLFAK